MSRITKASPWLSCEDLKARLNRTNDRQGVQKTLVVLNATIRPRLAKDIAEHVGVGTQTVHNWMSVYNRFGPEAFFDKKPRKPSPKLLTDEEERSFIEPFIQKASTGQIATAAQIQQAFEDFLGFTVHHSTVYRLLERHQWRKVIPRPAHPKGDPRTQEDFKKKLPDTVSEIVAQRDPDDCRPVVLMQQDEGRFGRINYCNTSCWAPKGIRPKVPRQIVRTYIYVYSAVCMALGKMTSLILPYANTEMMNIFLRHVAADFKDYFVIMLLDGAGWHKSGRLVVPENIRLVNLPPYSPELNSAEHIWEYLRENAMPNIAFKSLDHLERALSEHLMILENDPDRVRSMTYFPYLRITCN